MILQVIWLVVLMGAIPLILGIPWIKVFHPKHPYAFAYSTGFFIALALFQAVCFPVIMTAGSFSIIVTTYSIALIIVCGFSIWYSRKQRLTKMFSVSRIHWAEWIYLMAFLVIVGIQIIRAFTYDITYMSYDDATYTVIAADAYEGNGVLNITNNTGVAGNLNTKYALAPWNIYAAYFATISGFSVTTIAHTVQYVQLIILAYATYWFVAGEILNRRENQLIFMLIISLFFWFGYHSHYSLTFRLLGPNYQGKAVLAVSLTPLILAVLIKKLDEAYSPGTAVYLFILSIAGLALTLWGTGTVFVIVLVPLVFSLLRKERNWKHLLYMPWACIVPVLAFCYFLLNRYTI